MKKSEVGMEENGDLRRRAEDALQERTASPDELPSGDAQRLVYELQVHQVELELQNEELRRAQEELETSRDRYFDLYDLAPVGYFTLSREGLILGANLTGAAMLGVRRDRLVKRPFSRFVLRDDQDEFYRHHLQLFETMARQTCELRMLQEGGAPFYAHLVCNATQDRAGAACRIAVSDVSERVRAQEALKEYAERLEDMVEARTQELCDAQEQLLRQEKLAALGQLAGGVAHELRNPLSGINCATYLLDMILEEPEPDTREALNILQQESRNAENIIKSLLNFAHARPPVRQQVDVNRLIREALSRAPAPESIQVLPQLDESLPLAAADRVQLAEVFDHIILNAVQAMTPPYAGKDGGRLLVQSQVVDRDGQERVRVSFSDTGVGIPAENLDKIFDPLFTTKARGIGLGLALCKRLLEGQAGQIEVLSEVGKGSCFSVSLPVYGATAGQF